jgi:hypothetical protein
VALGIRFDSRESAQTDGAGLTPLKTKSDNSRAWVSTNGRSSGYAELALDKRLDLRTIQILSLAKAGIKRDDGREAGIFRRQVAICGLLTKATSRDYLNVT